MSRCYVVSVKFEVIIWFTLYDFESSSDGGGGDAIVVAGG